MLSSSIIVHIVTVIVYRDGSCSEKELLRDSHRVPTELQIVGALFDRLVLHLGWPVADRRSLALITGIFLGLQLEINQGAADLENR